MSWKDSAKSVNILARRKRASWLVAKTDWPARPPNVSRSQLRSGFLPGGYLAHSLAIMTDAAHLLTDFGSMMVSLFSLWISSRPPNKTMNFGWHRSGQDERSDNSEWMDGGEEDEWMFGGMEDDWVQSTSNRRGEKQSMVKLFRFQSKFYNLFQLNRLAINRFIWRWSQCCGFSIGRIFREIISFSRM